MVRHAFKLGALCSLETQVWNYSWPFAMKHLKYHLIQELVQLIPNQMDLLLIQKLEFNLRGANKRCIEPNVSLDWKWLSLCKILCSIFSTETENQRWAV